MNREFRSAVAHYKQVLPALTHSQRVCRLYRRALKTAYSWAVFRSKFIEEAEEIRAKFDEYAHIDPLSKKAEVLLKKGEEAVAEFTHPDPYVNPYMPGGTLYMRNPPVPLFAVHNGHLAEGVEESFVNPDMSRVRDGEKGTVGRVLVNFSTKEML